MHDVAIIGVGLHPFGRFEGKTAMQMGVDAITAAVDDAGVQWTDIQFGVGGSWTVANPDAIVLLSTRSSADAWWKSASETIFIASTREIPPEHAEVMGAQLAMIRDLFARFCPDWQDQEAATRAYEEHNAAVRAAVDPARLVDWQPGDGWAPLCAALDVPVPDDPFPHVNTTADFRAMIGLE